MTWSLLIHLHVMLVQINLLTLGNGTRTQSWGPRGRSAAHEASCGSDAVIP